MSISENVTMFYNASPKIFERAKSLRDNMTRSEKILWEQLSGKKMLNLRFRAQHPTETFITDFYCHPLKLVIKIDGGIHKSADQKEYDTGREAELNKWEIKVIRFTNEEIENNINNVLNEIKQTCIARRKEF